MHQGATQSKEWCAGLKPGARAVGVPYGWQVSADHVPGGGAEWLQRRAISRVIRVSVGLLRIGCVAYNQILPTAFAGDRRRVAVGLLRYLSSKASEGQVAGRTTAGLEQLRGWM